MRVVVRREWELVEHQGQVLSAVLSIHDLDMHVRAVRVHDVDGEQMAYQDPSDVFRTVCDADPDGRFETTAIPGFEGRWVIIATPFQD